LFNNSQFNNSQFVIFDCDGVIIDSNRLKMRGFKEALQEYDDHLVAELLEYNLVNGGLARDHKFRYFFKQLLSMNTNDTEKLTELKSKQFNQYCLKHFPTLPLTSGFIDYLQRLKSNDIPCYIVSGGNKGEIQLLVNQHKISSYFKGIYGNEQSKPDAIKLILTTANYQPENGTFFGDSALDGRAANQFGIPFIFVSEYADVSTSELSELVIHKVIDNFTPILS